jgi:protein-disulfide isomerase-like protein with CxxC motif
MVAAELRWTNTVATVALAEAVQRRAHGKGRRPHERAIQGLMKRQGLTFNTWQEAERKLEEMTGQQRSSVATALRRAAR